MPIVKIAAVIVDEREITLYKTDGNTIIIRQGDARVRKIIDTVLPVVQNGGIADLDLEILGVENDYKNFEQKSGGIVRFFRVAKEFVSKIFNPDEEAVAPTGTFGSVNQTKAAVDTIIANATPVSHPEYSESETTDEHTIVAVVNNKAIPGAEQLKSHIQHGARYSPDALGKFYERLAGMIDQRPHSVNDLLRFIENGDLPLADDGSIIAYKRLQMSNNEGIFVDCHTRNVRQRVGSLVRVSEDLVDRNRRNECSNGLHIARRAYLKSFNGNVLVLCKIAPEDVVVVPHGDPNKVRVCAYHILDQITGDAFDKLTSNRPATDNPELAKQVARALRGDYPPPIEVVEVTQQQGGGVVITSLQTVTHVPESTIEPTVADAAIDDPRNVQEQKAKETSEPINPKLVAAETVAVQSRAARLTQVIGIISDPNQASQVRIDAANEAITIQKAAKKGWAALGRPGMSNEYLHSLINTLQAAKPAQPEAKPEGEAKAKQPVSEGRKDKARRLFTTHQWAELWKLKQSMKISWASMGFTESEIEVILRNR